MKHGRKANWTKEKWGGYKLLTLDYFDVTMKKARMAGQAVKIMEDRED